VPFGISTNGTVGCPEKIAVSAIRCAVDNAGHLSIGGFVFKSIPVGAIEVSLADLPTQWGTGIRAGCADLHTCILGEETENMIALSTGLSEGTPAFVFLGSSWKRCISWKCEHPGR
jgi:hypothetical protein